MRDHPTEPEQSQKRQKTSNEATDETVITEGGATVGGQEPTQGADVAAAAPAEEVDEQALREAEVGITTFVSPELPGFEGVLKKRYTDFLVNEIVPSGEVLHLKSAELPELFKQALGRAPSAFAARRRAIAAVIL
ncbi:hypothetical protein KEM55_008170 [Ascosphaera atra]|nr:hypothetical protein KEM55_008170 [Ascosphaera atra]